MLAKINVASHISLHTWSRLAKFFHIPDGRETTLATGHQDDNKNTYEANILWSLTFKVFQKQTFFSHKTFATTIAETSRRRNVPSPNCPRPGYFYPSENLNWAAQNIRLGRLWPAGRDWPKLGKS